MELRKRWMKFTLRPCDPADWSEAQPTDMSSDLGRDEVEIAEIRAYPEPLIPAIYNADPVQTQ